MLQNSSSEKFFAEIHQHFQAAQKEIKLSSTGLLILEHGSNSPNIAMMSEGEQRSPDHHSRFGTGSLDLHVSIKELD